MFKSGMKLLIGLAALALVLVAWTGVALAYFLFDPTLAQWTVIVTIAAVATEVAVWIGAAILGISALQRLRRWTRLRRSG